MKKQFNNMKPQILIKLATCVAIYALVCSCSEEKDTPNIEQFTAFTGGIISESPITRVSINASESLIEPFAPSTRTSMERTEIGGRGNFFWEPGDYIYVQDDSGELFKSQNHVTEMKKGNTFLVDGTYTSKTSYNVYYYGNNSGSDPKKVTISTNQNQSEFNSTKHFGTAGDCGVAVAQKITEANKKGYKFDLVHKASYICFLPFIPEKTQRENNKIQKIELTSNNNVAGTYDLSSDGLSGTGSSKTITLHVGDDGLLLADQTDGIKKIENSLYMVVAPGTHTFSVKYTIFDTRTNKTFNIIRNYGSHTLAPNKIYDIAVNLYIMDYYMWDARESYWSGHEWYSSDPWQPTEPQKPNSNYPREGIDPNRWFNDRPYHAREASVNPLFKSLPNANEIAWYVLKGDARWEYNVYWQAFGKPDEGGIWIKKIDVIAKEQGKTRDEMKARDPMGNDLRVTKYDWTYRGQYGRPNKSVIDNYFFLPTMGTYWKGQLYGKERDITTYGRECGCWSSTGVPGKPGYAYALRYGIMGIGLGPYVNLNFIRCDYGLLVRPLE